MRTGQRPAPLNLRAGDLVEVLGVDEILATLDDRGRYEGLPFMPEMLQFCGRRLRVASRADKTCGSRTLVRYRYHVPCHRTETIRSGC